MRLLTDGSKMLVVCVYIYTGRFKGHPKKHSQRQLNPPLQTDGVLQEITKNTHTGVIEVPQTRRNATQGTQEPEKKEKNR